MKPRPRVFDIYWKFAAERQKIFYKKIDRFHPPYTKDPILQAYKFCNVYRVSDRVSQFLIKEVIYQQSFSEEDVLFRIFLFRLLNRIETWKALENKLGKVRLNNFKFSQYSKILTEIKSQDKPIYGNAFILCANKAFDFNKKHENHLALLEKVFIKDKSVTEFIKTKSLKNLFLLLRRLPLIGNFMAYQISIDFNYSEVFDFNENDFTIAGPGAVRGINKCFIKPKKDFSSIIRWMVENQKKEFSRLGLKFLDLWGRPLHAIDCQGLFCEVDKYCRIKFPEIKSNRVRIKSKYKPNPKSIDYFYPPKWNINDKVKRK